MQTWKNWEPQGRREGEEEWDGQMKSWNPPKPRNWEQPKVSTWICEELSVVDVGLSDEWSFTLLMRRKRTQALFLNCAPEDVLSTTKVSLSTSEDQESLRHFEQCKARWLSDVVWESQPKSTFPLWGSRTRKRTLKMRDLGFKPKQRCSKKLCFELFMSSMHNTFTSWIFSGYMVYWLTNTHMNAIS